MLKKKTAELLGLILSLAMMFTTVFLPVAASTVPRHERDGYDWSGIGDLRGLPDRAFL